MDSIFLCTLNVNGIRSKFKRNTVFKYLRQQKYDIICLQETYITDSDYDQWKKEWGGDLFYTSVSKQRMGQVILLRKGLQFAMEKEINSDRILSLSFMTDKGKINVINAYAPTIANEKKIFLDTLANYLNNIEGEVILCGDFNCVLDNDKDIISGEKHYQSNVEKFNDVISNYALNDTWRIFHPDDKEFTWSRKSPLIARRLDYIFISEAVLNSVNFCDIKSVAHSDHRLVQMKFMLTNIKRGPSYWKCNDSLLTDQLYLDTINEAIETFKSESTDLEPRLRWDLCKVKIRECSITYSIERKRKNTNKKFILENKLNEIDKHLSRDPNNQDKIKEKACVKTELELFSILEAKSAQIRSRVKFIEEGEKNTKYFLSIEKSRANAKIMDKLINENGTVINTQDKILQEQVKHYSGIYKKKREFDVNQANNFVQKLNIPKISENQMEILETNITLDELTKTLKTMKNNSAPGPDGLTFSFLKVFWNRINDLIFESFLSGFRAGEMSFTQRQAVITLIHKGKDLSRENLSNWRPISLTNTDYKILAKSLANRLSSVLPDIIDKDQVGFVRGRKISTTIRLIDDTLEYLKNSHSPGILLAVDYSRAFDSISKEYMLWAFKQFGIGENFMKWVQVLLHNTESKMNYLGWLSESFPVECGIRQGCPFSPLAFIVGLELLAIKIRSDNDIKGIALPVPSCSVKPAQSLKIALYADDITLFLHNKKDLKKVLELLDIFSVSSNLEINKNKTEAMWVGSAANNTETLCNIRWKNKIKILGIYFSGVLPASSIEENWNSRIMKIKELIAVWSKRNLSISGKLCIIKSYLLSQITHLLQSLVLPDNVLTNINSILFRFLWKKKYTNKKAFEKVKRSVVCSAHEAGGLNMINVIDMQNSFLLALPFNLLLSQDEKVFEIPKHMFSKLGPDLICFKTNASNKSFIGLELISSNYWRRVLQVWIENKYKLEQFNNITNNFKNDCLWNNNNIMYKGNCLFFPSWSKAGFNYVSDIIYNDHILSFEYINEKLGNKASTLFEYNALKAALQKVNNIIREVTQQPTSTSLNASSPPTARQIRILLTKAKSTLPCSVHFWERKLNYTLTPLDWLIAKESTNEERLRLLHWKILHNIYPTNILLHKMGLRENNLCPDCKEIDYIEHFFWSCKKVQIVWELCKNIIFKELGISINFTLRDILFGYSTSEYRKHAIQFINHMILISKLVISKFKYGTPYDARFIFEKETSLRIKN